MLVVASVIKNRMDSGVWGGTDAYSVTTARGQFESYLKGHYQQYTGKLLPRWNSSRRRFYK